MHMVTYLHTHTYAHGNERTGLSIYGRRMFFSHHGSLKGKTVMKAVTSCCLGSFHRSRMHLFSHSSGRKEHYGVAGIETTPIFFESRKSISNDDTSVIMVVWKKSCAEYFSPCFSYSRLHPHPHPYPFHPPPLPNSKTRGYILDGIACFRIDVLKI